MCLNFQKADKETDGTKRKSLSVSEPDNSKLESANQEALPPLSLRMNVPHEMDLNEEDLGLAITAAMNILRL